MAANPAKIDVAIRLRPLLEQEKMYGLRQSRIKINPASNEVRLLDPEGRNAKSFVFDKVVGGNCSQEEFYDSIEIQRYIDHVLEGYHATVFVYGQTGAGKTYTMEGLEYDLTNNRSSQQRKPNKIIGMKDAGIIPRVIKDLFEKIPVISKKYGRNYNVYCSFLELYNEKIFDLLNPDQVDRISNTSPGLKLRWHKKDQFLVENLYVFACSSPQELEFLFQMGVKNKTMASHRLNNASSRSHCIFEIKIEFSDVNSPDDVVVSKFALVDLAGSERASVVNAEGRMAKEAIEINKSLFTLRQVINAIFESQNRGAKTDYHIPYRESKLTSLLKQSIGGNAYCVMVACLSPIDENFEENLSTLGYASKVTKIQNEPIRNDDPRWAVIQTLKVENVDLLKKLDDANKQILYLTENIPNAKQDGHRQDENGRYPRQEAEGEIQMRGPNSQYGGYLDQIESNLKIPYVPGSNPSNLPMEAGTEEFAFSENLTQQLVVAINQIRELLEALKRERERNEGLSLKMEQNDNTIAVLMHENQELRDHINQLESMHPHSHSRTRARSGSTQKNRNPYSKPNAANTSFTHAPFPPSSDNRNKSFTSQDTTTLKNVMPKIGGQPHSQSYTQSYGQSMFQNQGEGKWNQSPLQTAQSNNLKNMQEALQMENHYRTTTMFARNAMYRRGNTTTGRNMSDTQSEFHPSFVDKNSSVVENESRSQISPGRMRQDETDKFMDENEGYERKGSVVEQRKQMIIPEETKDYYMNQRGSKSGEKGKERTATPLGKIRDNSTGEKRP